MLLTAGKLYAEQITPWLRELAVGLSPWGVRFNPRYVHVALNRFLSKYFSSPKSINPQATDSIVIYLTKNYVLNRDEITYERLSD
jgi:hypothetical protein